MFLFISKKIKIRAKQKRIIEAQYGKVNKMHCSYQNKVKFIIIINFTSYYIREVPYIEYFP